MFNQVERAQRKHIIYFTKIQTGSGKKFTGRLVDISEKGLKVVMKEKVIIGGEYNFEISIPKEKVKEGKETIKCWGKAVWYKQHINPAHYTAGFEITSITEEDKLEIEHFS